jgi:hypothetical protein
MVWTPQLRRFRVLHGHCNVPQQYRVEAPPAPPEAVADPEADAKDTAAMNSLGTWVTILSLSILGLVQRSL